MAGSPLGGQLRDSQDLRIEEPAPDHEQSDGLRASRRPKGPLQLARISDLEWQQFPPPLPGGGFGCLPRGGVLLVAEDRHRPGSGGDLLQQLELLADQLGPLEAQPRDVAARAGETLNESHAHRVVGTRHYDGDGCGCLPERTERRADSYDHVDLETQQLVDQIRETLGVTFGPANLGHEMLSVHVAALPQSSQESVDESVPGLWPDHGGG